MRISACWIAKNESENIARSINSVRGIADELIVVDTGSDDNTAEVAVSLGARLEHFAWIDDFSAARNYALQFATGDIVIFLDADEWFAPSLDPASRQTIENTFASNNRLRAINQPLINVNKNGEPSTTTIVGRIFRRKDARYVGKIHEHLQLPADSRTVTITNALHIKHSGYDAALLPEKLQRNLAVLEATAADAPVGSRNRIQSLMYQIREHTTLGQGDKAVEYLVEVMRYPNIVIEINRALTLEYVSTLYAMIRTAQLARGRVSRKQVKRNIISLFKTLCPDYPGTIEIDLLYQLFFHFQEDRLLRELPQVARQAAEKQSPVDYYKDPERMLFRAAAIAAWRRRDPLRVLDYALHALQGKSNRVPIIKALLCVLKGQPPEEVIHLLNSVMDIRDPGNLDQLIEGTALDGWIPVHSYYLKKRIDKYNYPDDVLRLMLIHEKYEAIAATAREADEASSSTMHVGGLPIVFKRHERGGQKTSLYVFLAALCGAPRELIEGLSGMIEKYAHITHAFENGASLPEVCEDDASLLRGTYSTVAFAAGLDTAERYARVFAADPKLCYLAKAQYCEASGLAKYLLEVDMGGIDRWDFSCYRYKIQALIFAGRYEEALLEIGEFFGEEILEQDLMHMLLVVAEKASGQTKALARRMYDRYRALFDEIIDLEDVVNTGVVFDMGGATYKKALKGMTMSQFDKLLGRESERPATRKLGELCRMAADVYRKKGLPSEAARCLIRLAACGQATLEDNKKLAEVMKRLRNTTLSACIEKGAPHPSPAAIR